MRKNDKFRVLSLMTVISFLTVSSVFSQSEYPIYIDATVDGDGVTAVAGTPLSYEIDVPEAGDYYFEIFYRADNEKNQPMDLITVDVDGTILVDASDMWLLNSTDHGGYKIPSLDENGDPLIDENGDPVMEDAITYYWEGFIPEEQATDENGDPLVDENGDPVMLDFAKRVARKYTLAAGKQNFNINPAEGGWQLKAVRFFKEQLPFHGSPFVISSTETSRLEFEDYDKGPHGIAHAHDIKFGGMTQGGQRGRFENPPVMEHGTGYAIGGFSFQKGEFYEYTVNVEKAGTYDFQIHYGSGRNPGGWYNIEARESVSDTIFLVCSSKVLDNDFTGGGNFGSFSTFINYPADYGDNLNKLTDPAFLGEINRLYEGWVPPTQFVFPKSGKQVFRLNASLYATNGAILDYIEFTFASEDGADDDPGTSINEVGSDNAKAFPNPSSTGVFNMAEYGKWKVYTLSGSVVLSGEGTVIDLSNFPRGMYLLETNEGISKLLSK